MQVKLDNLLKIYNYKVPSESMPSGSLKYMFFDSFGI